MEEYEITVLKDIQKKNKEANAASRKSFVCCKHEERSGPEAKE